MIAAERRGLLLVSTLLAVGCAGGEYSVEVRLPAGALERARAIELALLPGSCAGQSLGAPPEDAAQRVSLRREGERGAFTPASAGAYGVYALARDAACAPVAAGCTEVDLVPGGSGSIVVALEAVSGGACSACDDGVCGQFAMDAGPDGGDRDGGGDDGGPRDGGPSDAGSDGGRDAGIDAGTDAGPPSLCPSGALFCDDFEALAPGDFAPWLRAVLHSGSEITPATPPAPVHEGEQAARMHTPGPSARAALQHELASPLGAGDDLWVRTYLYVPNDGDQFTFAGFSLFYLVPRAGDQGVSLQIRRDGTYFNLAPVLEDDPEADPFVAAMGTVPRGRWTCVEVFLELGDHGRAELYFDGVSRGALSDVDTLAASGYGSVVLGLERALGSQGPATIYLDDVAISTSRPGC